ncbi:MAG: dTDP-4-dehydrorhamnose reductase [Bacteroidota bacterium]
MKKIMITGANGQLGNCLKKISHNYPSLTFQFLKATDLDITDADQIEHCFQDFQPDFCINAAAYTNVEQAENKSDKAFLINEKAVQKIAIACQKYQTTLLHISTDYVFDGKSAIPYTEEAITNPINVYGASKLAGEKAIQQQLENYFIVRTSWLYAEFGANFYRTMLEKARQKASLKITTEQTGTPTNANDLAEFLLHLIQQHPTDYGIYHFSNLGSATWYDFAIEIFQNAGILSQVDIKASNAYKTLAKRPKNSVLSKDKVQQKFNFPLKNWKESLTKLQEKSHN